MKRETGSFLSAGSYRLPLAGIAAAGLLLSACGGGGGGSSSSGGGGNKATACLNEDLYTVGTDVDQSTLAPTMAVHTASTVTKKASFNNVPNLTETESLEETGLPQAPQLIYQTQTRQRYTRLDGDTLLTFGDVTVPSLLPVDPLLAPFQDPFLTGILQILGPTFGLGTVDNSLVAITTTVTNTPAIEKRFDLSPGQSYTQNYSSVSNTNVTALDGQTTIPVINGLAVPTTVKTTYVGRESVTVQAGTFEACKFTDEVTTTGGTAVTTTWLAVGSGLFLKSETGSGASTQLVSGSINGAPL